ncbi:hypothetical protein CJ671_06385 [Aliarcobacter cryaerophilus]|uniref:Uncharacterized protein n=1 Tax=Aliarcobacter cryaerophilus TaxID=28198 RepID=A0A2S9ST34_9BACT|nr:hypothetical protein [Aliarcobacter cryaerophilus]PRM89738.1 hypothetical protein CJ671_06385 [Aliarcobacter cryaerophilus]
MIDSFFDSNNKLLFKKLLTVLGVIAFSIIILILAFKYVILSNTNIDGFDNKKEFMIKIKIKNINKKINDELDLNNNSCKKIDKKNYYYSCIKPEDGEYSYIFDKHEGIIKIMNEKNIYEIEIDNEDYQIRNNELILNDDVLSGKFKLVKDDGSPKYIENKNISFKIYDSIIDNSKITNGYVSYKKTWSEFSNIYYGFKKLSVDYSIDNEIYTVSKPYLLTNDLDLNEVFSMGQIYNTLNNDLEINDVLKINNEKLIVSNRQNLPNINLITINAKNDEDLNGFITFTINNLHKDGKINLFYDGKFIFSIYAMNYIFNNELDKTFIGGNEKEVNLIDDKLIEKVKISFFKNNDKCQIIATVNNYKPAKSEFNCNEIQTKKTQNITSLNFQINAEKKVCNNGNFIDNCILFEISDIKTGKDERDMY